MASHLSNEVYLEWVATYAMLPFSQRLNEAWIPNPQICIYKSPILPILSAICFPQERKQALFWNPQTAPFFESLEIPPEISTCKSQVGLYGYHFPAAITPLWLPKIGPISVGYEQDYQLRMAWSKSWHPFLNSVEFLLFQLHTHIYILYIKYYNIPTQNQCKEKGHLLCTLYLCFSPHLLAQLFCRKSVHRRLDRLYWISYLSFCLHAGEVDT